MENKLQVLTLEDRKRLSLSGVLSVDGFTDEKIKLKVLTGNLIISGEKLKINVFSEGSGAFSCEGKISSVVFSEGKQGIVKRLFK